MLSRHSWLYITKKYTVFAVSIFYEPIMNIIQKNWKIKSDLWIYHNKTTDHFIMPCNIKVINNKEVNHIEIKKKRFKNFQNIEMEFDPKDYWYCILWSHYWLWSNNELSDEYLEVLKNKMSRVWLVNLLKRLVDKKMIKRVKRWKYVLNPNIWHYWKVVSRSVVEMFE